LHTAMVTPTVTQSLTSNPNYSTNVKIFIIDLQIL
jgi:hypothetical protein